MAHRSRARSATSNTKAPMCASRLPPREASTSPPNSPKASLTPPTTASASPFSPPGNRRTRARSSPLILQLSRQPKQRPDTIGGDHDRSLEDEQKHQSSRLAQGRRRSGRPCRGLRRHYRISLRSISRAKGSALSRNGGERRRRYLEEMPGRYRHQDRIHHGNDRRRHQTRHHPAQFVRR